MYLFQIARVSCWFKKAYNAINIIISFLSVYYREIIAHRNFNLNILEMETNTKITIPLNGMEGNLTIIGEDETNIVEARHQVHSVIEHIRNAHRPMQFISIPTLSDEIRNNFEKFKVRF